MKILGFAPFFVAPGMRSVVILLRLNSISFYFITIGRERRQQKIKKKAPGGFFRVVFYKSRVG